MFVAVMRPPRTRVFCIPVATGPLRITHRAPYTTPLVTFNSQFEKWLRVSDAHEFLGYLDFITGSRAVQFL